MKLNPLRKSLLNAPKGDSQKYVYPSKLKPVIDSIYKQPPNLKSISKIDTPARNEIELKPTKITFACSCPENVKYVIIDNRDTIYISGSMSSYELNQKPKLCNFVMKDGREVRITRRVDNLFALDLKNCF